MSCSGDCKACGGCSCAGSLELTMPEIRFLEMLGQVAFLPAVRTMSDPAPIWPECPKEEWETTGLVLQCLEKKQLICADFRQPLKGCDASVYAGYTIRGSLGLTQRGQQVLELLELQGYES